MPQIKFRADTKAINFPLLSNWADRSVMHPVNDIGQHYIQDSTAMYQPGVIYVQDVMPTDIGYKSVSYRNLVAAASPANTNFSKIFTATDPNMNMSLIGITTDSHIYMITAAGYNWTDVTPANWAGGDAVTMGNSNGNYYLYLSQFGCYQINPVGVTLSAVTLNGINASDILGITSSVNYLILWDKETIYWNSNVNALDFTPSLITGAGSAVPFYLEGSIVFCEELNTGFIIYSTLNIVSAVFSNNTQYPWIFNSIPNGAGISSMLQVSKAKDLGFHVAFTSAGLLKISPNTAEVIRPEVTDFIAARIYETYDFTNNVTTQQVLSDNLITRLAVIDSRFIVLSYGITAPTDCIVYDILLNRWGKLHINHSVCFEIQTSVAVPPLAYVNPTDTGYSYASASPSTYNSVTSSFNSPPAVGNSFGFLVADGSLRMAYLDYNSDADNAVLILGKFQAIRTQLMELQEVEVESIPATNSSFNLFVAPSIDGKDTSSVAAMTLTQKGSMSRTYMKRAIGINYNLVFTGSFNLNSTVSTVVLGSRR